MEHTTIISHSKEALLSTYTILQDLGASGAEHGPINQFGDQSMQGDITAEEALISYACTHALPVRILSEEHGITDCTPDPLYLWVVDGIDGSIQYKAYHDGDHTARFGTLLTCYDSLTPSYHSYLFAGSLEHPSHCCYYAEKGRGAWCHHLTTGAVTPLTPATTDSFDEATRIYIDSNPHTDHYPLLESTFIHKLPHYTLQCLLSSAAHYADLARGAVDLVLECTRKSNLEIAYGYAMTREVGGAMLTPQGADMGPLPFLTYGQQEHITTVAACTYVLAKECLNALALRSPSVQ